MIKCKAILFGCLFLSLQGLSQENQISGVINELVDGKKQPVIGANIYYANKQPIIGTVTDVNGKFSIERLNEYHLLVVSFVGYANDTVDIREQSSFDIVLTNSVALNSVEIEARQKATSINYMESRQIQNIGEKELLKAACCNLSESFETSPSVDVAFTDAVTGTRTIQMLGLSGPYIQMTSGNMPDIRGLTAIYGLSFIPGTWIESIQLIKGTGSVINGYESIAGQINTEIRSPDDKYTHYVNGYVNRGTRIEANYISKKKLNEKWGMNILTHGATMIQALDMNDDSFVDMPINKQAIGQLNLRYKNDSTGVRSRISVKAGYMNKKGGQLLEDIPNPYTVGIEGSHVQVWAKRGKVNLLNPNRSVGLQVSGNYYDQTSYFGIRTYDASQLSFYGNLIGQRELKTNVNILKFGASFQYDNYNEVLDSANFSREEIVPGIFTEYTFDPNKKFTLVLGGRVDYHNQFGFFATPRMHFRYEVKKGTVLRGTAGRGQRTANVFAENIGYLSTSRQIRFKTDSTQYAYGLSPEVAWNYGLSLTQNFNLNYKEGVISLDFYRTDFVNQIIIDLDRDAHEIWYYNLDGKSYSNSFQAQIDYELIRRLDVRVAYRWFEVVSTIDGKDRLKPMMSPHRGFINVAYETKNAWNFDLTAQVQGKKRIPSTSFNPVQYERESTSPIFYLINGQISKTWFETTEVYVGVENLLNYKQQNPIIASDDPFGKYFDSSLIWGPIFGRNIYFGFRYKFK